MYDQSDSRQTRSAELQSTGSAWPMRAWCATPNRSATSCLETMKRYSGHRPSWQNYAMR
jgi:hypothetical protein